jgi:sporulation protein YtfJ
MDYQISDIVETAVSNLSKVAEVDTIIGKPVKLPNGATIMPISQINFAFMAGGGEYGNCTGKLQHDEKGKFAGGSGGGASLQPIGFLVVDDDGVRVLNVNEVSNTNKIIEFALDLFQDNGKKKD